MAVIGNSPATTFPSIRKQSITGDGDSAYSLDFSVTNENDLEVFVNNVRQEPTVAYTAGDQTITFSEGIDSTDDVYMIYKAQTFGNAVPADNTITTAMVQGSAITSKKLHDSQESLTLSGTLSVSEITSDLTHNGIEYSDSGGVAGILTLADSAESLKFKIKNQGEAFRIDAGTTASNARRININRGAEIVKPRKNWNYNNETGSPSSITPLPYCPDPWTHFGTFQFRGERYLHIKTTRVTNAGGPMEQFYANGYLYNQGIFDAHVGFYCYTSGIIAKHVRNNCTSGGIDAYASTDNKMVLRLDRNNTGYTEGRVTILWRDHSVQFEGRTDQYTNAPATQAGMPEINDVAWDNSATAF